MKKLNTLFTAALLLSGVLVGCNQSGDTPLTPSEKVMNTFISKIQNGGYTISSDKATFSVYSKDMMMVEYAKTTTGAKDYAAMSIYNDEYNAYETFQVALGASGDIFKYVIFKDKGRMVDVMSNQLLNYWITATDGNSWEAWHSVPDNPLLYKTSSMVVIKSIQGFYTMATSDLSKISNIELEFTSDKIEEAHLTFDITSGTLEPEEVDITLTFGGEIKYDQRIVDWMNNSDREYPASIATGWTSTYEALINERLRTAYFAKYVPLIPFASYATIPVDKYLLDLDGFARVHDYHAKESDMQAYADVLLENGFKPFEEKGPNCYYKHMRTKADDPAFMVYSMISMSYDDGLNIDYTGYYNRQYLTSLDELNSIITPRFFPEFEESDAITGFNGFNSPLEASEGVVYFNNFETDGLYYFQYEDADAIDAYIADYESKLSEAGFVKSEDVYTDDHFDLITSEGQATILIYPKADGVVHMKIGFTRFMNKLIVLDTLNKLGFPEISGEHISYAKDVTFYTDHTGTGGNWAIFWEICFQFDSADEATTFFNNYETAIKNSGKYVPGTGLRQIDYFTSDGSQTIQADNLGTQLMFWFGSLTK